MPDSLSLDVKVPAPPKTADDINELFNDIDDKPEKEPTKAKPAKEEKEDKEEKPDIEKLEPEDVELKEGDEDEPEKLDLKADDLDIEAPPRKKEILNKYPDLFKNFPFLEKMMYRDKEYTQLFGSFDDAKELAEQAETFHQFESQLLAGNTEEVLKNIKDVDEKAFNLIVDDYLPTLAKVDKDAYFHVTGNLNRRLIMEMVEEANNLDKTDSDKADQLRQAALLVNQFIFGTSKFTAPTRRVEKPKEGDTERSEVEQERINFTRERFETTRDELQTKADNTLRATISDYIDPKGVMSAYVKKNAVNDAMNMLHAAIASDSTVVKALEKLWRVSFEERFSRESQNKILSYYLSKAKGNLKNAILKARTEALKDVRPANRDKETDEQEEETSRRPARNIPPGRPRQERGKTDGPKKGESVTDFFMRD